MNYIKMNVLNLKSFSLLCGNMERAQTVSFTHQIAVIAESKSSVENV